MFVVIFRAQIRSLDEQYFAAAARMRDLALAEFGCIEFHAVAEGQDEVALSYWPNEESIKAWRAHPEHVEAQRLGKEKWYASYSVEVARISRKYGTAG
jgi:heme-degrading monooxygenase HmoA